jgi:signal transduction histidine kinase
MENQSKAVADRTAHTLFPLGTKIAIQQRTDQRLQRARDNLAVLYGISALANQSLNLRVFLSESIARTVQALHSDTGIVFLLDGDQMGKAPSKLLVAAHHGLAHDEINHIHSVSGNRGVATWVIDHRETLVISDLSQDSRFPVEMRRMGPVSLVLAPIRVEARVLGIMGLARPHRHSYRSEEIALLSSIADQVGIVIQSDRLRQQAQRATILEERQRLARDLHDSVAQALYTIVLLADAGNQAAEMADLPQVQNHLKDLGEIALQVLKEMRLLIYELRPQTLEQEGLLGALRRRLETVENRAGARTELVTHGVINIPWQMELDVYRIAEEALNNILKHSGASRLSVTLSTLEDRVCLDIEDNGKGFNAELSGRNCGIGLESMCERAKQLGGILEITSTPGTGTHIRLCVPLH